MIEDSQVESTDVELTSDGDSQTVSDKYQVGQWVVVRYAGKRVVSHFVGQVLENVEEGVKVSFLKHQPGSHICQRQIFALDADAPSEELEVYVDIRATCQTSSQHRRHRVPVQDSRHRGFQSTCRRQQRTAMSQPRPQDRGTTSPPIHLWTPSRLHAASCVPGVS